MARVLALYANMGLGRKKNSGKNPLAYFVGALMTKTEFCNIGCCANSFSNKNLNAEADKLLKLLFIKRHHQISSLYLLRLLGPMYGTTNTVSQVQCYNIWS
jgi:hypothetical protein